MRMTVKCGMLAACLVAGVARGESGEKPVPPAEQVLAACRARLPLKPVQLEGAIVVRSRKGIVRSEYDYTLRLDRSQVPAVVTVELRARGTTNVLSRTEMRRPGPIPEGQVLDTDVSWLDLSLDYLWWLKPRYDTVREGESVHGQKCLVLLADPPDAAAGAARARLWADRKTECLLQVELLDANDKPIKRLWGTRVKKFGERWMANVLETEAPGSGRRTKITIESITDL